MGILFVLRRFQIECLRKGVYTSKNLRRDFFYGFRFLSTWFMLGIHVLFGFTREPIHVGPSPKKNKSSASRYEIPKTDPNFFAQTRFTSSKFTSGFRFFHFLRRESGGRESRAQTLYLGLGLVLMGSISIQFNSAFRWEGCKILCALYREERTAQF